MARSSEAALIAVAQVSDTRRIIVARGLRSFAYGMFAVAFGLWPLARV